MSDTVEDVVRIREYLKANKLTHLWLLNELSKKGLKISANRLNDVLSLKRKLTGPRTLEIVSKSVCIIERYEQVYVQGNIQ